MRRPNPEPAALRLQAASQPVTRERRRTMLLALGLVIVYLAAYQHGAGAAMSRKKRCPCAERSAVPSAEADVTGQAMADCVVRHMRAERAMHPELARCLHATGLSGNLPSNRTSAGIGRGAAAAGAGRDGRALPGALHADGVVAAHVGRGGGGSQGGDLARGAPTSGAGLEPRAGAGNASQAGPRAEKKVISYSLYGANPKYVLGAERNADLIHTVFPGWVARFYVDAGTVPEATQAALRRHGAEVIPIDMSKRGHQSMFWRFFAAADPTVDRFISRDVDSRLMPRDAVVVSEWEASDFAFHVIRDHPSHSRYPMSGGLWGCVKGALPEIMTQIDSYPANSNYLTDMNFLNSVVWPRARNRTLQHDSFSCDVYPGARAYPVPPDMGGAHVGQVFDESGASRPIDVQMILSAQQPAACRPGGTGFSSAAAVGVADPHDECTRLRRLYQVEPGRSWGGLPAPLEPRWHKLECDRLAAPQSRRGRHVGGGGSPKGSAGL